MSQRAAGRDDAPRRVDVHRPLCLRALRRPMATRVRVCPDLEVYPAIRSRRHAGEPAGEGGDLRTQPAVRLDAVQVADGPGAGVGPRPGRRRLAGHPQRRRPVDVPARRPARGARPRSAFRPSRSCCCSPPTRPAAARSRTGTPSRRRPSESRPASPTDRSCVSRSVTKGRRAACPTASSGSSRTGPRRTTSPRSTAPPTSTSTRRRRTPSRPRSWRRSRHGAARRRDRGRRHPRAGAEPRRCARRMGRRGVRRRRSRPGVLVRAGRRRRDGRVRRPRCCASRRPGEARGERDDRRRGRDSTWNASSTRRSPGTAR